MVGTDEFISVNELTISNAENGVACKAETNKGRNRGFPWKVTLWERSGESRDDVSAVKMYVCSLKDEPWLCGNKRKAVSGFRI